VRGTAFVSIAYPDFAEQLEWWVVETLNVLPDLVNPIIDGWLIRAFRGVRFSTDGGAPSTFPACDPAPRG